MNELALIDWLVIKPQHLTLFKLNAWCDVIQAIILSWILHKNTYRARGLVQFSQFWPNERRYLAPQERLHGHW